MKRAYFDHNATTPVDPRVLEAMLPWFGDLYGNSSSVHAHGQAARDAVEGARERVADLLSVEPPEVSVAREPLPDESAPGEPVPTERELAILKVLWDRGEGTVRQVYETLRTELPIVQNTVQAFLRTMEEKGLVDHQTRGRSFVYRPLLPRQQTNQTLVSRLLDRVFDGAIDQMVESALELRRPTKDELDRLRAMVEAAERREDVS